MSTVINTETDLAIVVGGRPLSAFPTTGPIAIMAEVGAVSVWLAGMHGTGTLVILPSAGKVLTVNILQGSRDDAILRNAASTMRRGRSPLAVSLTFGATLFVSGSLGIGTVPDYTVTADNGLFSPWTFVGAFSTATVGFWDAPGTLELEKD